MPLRSDDERLEPPLNTAAKAVRERLLAMLRNLGQLLDGSLDQKITAKFRRFGGSLLDQQHGRVKQLGALRAEADKVEEKIKGALESYEMTPISPEQLAKYLPKGELACSSASAVLRRRSAASPSTRRPVRAGRCAGWSASSTAASS